MFAAYQSNSVSSLSVGRPTYLNFIKVSNSKQTLSK